MLRSHHTPTYTLILSLSFFFFDYLQSFNTTIGDVCLKSSAESYQITNLFDSMPQTVNSQGQAEVRHSIEPRLYFPSFFFFPFFHIWILHQLRHSVSVSLIHIPKRPVFMDHAVRWIMLFRSPSSWTVIKNSTAVVVRFPVVVLWFGFRLRRVKLNVKLSTHASLLVIWSSNNQLPNLHLLSFYILINIFLPSFSSIFWMISCT